MNPFTHSSPKVPEETGDIKLSFSPTRQVLHQRSDFTVRVQDRNGIPNEAQLKLIYNGFDVTDSFISRTSLSSRSADRRTMNVTFSNIKLPAAVQNQIEVHYSRDGVEDVIVKNYAQPGCSIKNIAPPQNTGAFSPPKNWLSAINKLSKQENINPSLFAGIIAQESGFRAKSLSLARALGLSQITPIADRQIASVHADWPRSSSVESAPILLLKTMILSGHLDAESDWRLNPSLSIEGGVTYLGMVRKYWESPTNREMLKLLFGDDTEAHTQILLASYQSGPARVNAALRTLGKDYLMSEDLRQARAYVSRISSYCYFFSREEPLHED